MFGIHSTLGMERRDEEVHVFLVRTIGQRHEGLAVKRISYLCGCYVDGTRTFDKDHSHFSFAVGFMLVAVDGCAKFSSSGT